MVRAIIRSARDPGAALTRQELLETLRRTDEMMTEEMRQEQMQQAARIATDLKASTTLADYHLGVLR